MRRFFLTFKNCSSRIILPVGGTPMDALPFNERAARLLAMQKQQMSTDQYRATYNMLGQMYRARMEQATDYQAELSKPAGFMTVSHDTFYIDYIGSMHKTGYSDQITDVRFLCTPAAKNTLHLNVIEHNGEFRIACLACSDVSAIADAMDQVMKDHGLPVQSIPVQRFNLPMSAWREGIL